MKESGRLKKEDEVSYMKTFIEMRTKCPKDFIYDLHNKISFFVSDFKKRWLKSNRKEDRFLSKNKKWLDTSISFPNYGTGGCNRVGQPKNFVDLLTEQNVSKPNHCELNIRLKSCHL